MSKGDRERQQRESTVEKEKVRDRECLLISFKCKRTVLLYKCEKNNKIVH